MLPDLVIPWGATGANTNGLHVELCGFAAWSPRDWLARLSLLDRAAFKVARWCFHYDIPTVYVHSDGLRLGRRGITTHADVNAAFHGGTHYDPGPGFPRERFMAMVKEHLAVLL